MDDKLFIAIIGGVTSLIVAIITQLLTKWREYNLKQLEEKKKLQLVYLTPLRLHLSENYIRLSEILERIKTSNTQRCTDLLVIDNPTEIINKDSNWFNGYGCYLMSSCYITSCLFAYLNLARKTLPYLKLSKKEDAYLLNFLTDVSMGFLKNLGIYYVTQFSIGNEIYIKEDERILTYREFCELLQNENNLPWYSRLIQYYLDTGQGLNLERIETLLKSIKKLSNFLDKVVADGESLIQRQKSEVAITK